MPQGAPPKRPLSKPTRLSAAHSKNQKQKANTPRARVIKPTHNSVLARQNNMKNKGSGKLTGMLEKKLAERAGHTERIGKERDQQQQDKKKKRMGELGSQLAGVAAKK